MMKCEYCEIVYEATRLEVDLAFPPYKLSTEADSCISCKSLVVDQRVYALIKLNDYREALSKEALLFMAECVKLLDLRSFFVKDGDGLIVDGEYIGSLLGITEQAVRRVLNELFSRKLAGEVKVTNGAGPLKFLMINGSSLDLINKEDFIEVNFFAHGFFAVTPKDVESSRRRSLRKSSLINDFSKEEREEVLNKFNGKCALTGKAVDLHLDHVIPLAVGHGGTTKANMLPIWQRINSSKRDRNIFEWYENNGERFGVVPELFDRAIEYLAELNDMTVAEYRDYVYECHANPNDNLTEVL